LLNPFFDRLPVGGKERVGFSDVDNLRPPGIEEALSRQFVVDIAPLGFVTFETGDAQRLDATELDGMFDLFAAQEIIWSDGGQNDR
jgi:hypothetical protein